MAGRVALVVVVLLLSSLRVQMQEPDPAAGIIPHTHEYLSLPSPICHPDHCLPLLFEGDRGQIQHDYPLVCLQHVDTTGRNDRVNCVPMAHVLDLVGWGKVQ